MLQTPESQSPDVVSAEAVSSLDGLIPSRAAQPQSKTLHVPKTVYLSLDAWRGIAALWVFSIHATTPIYHGALSALASNPFWLFCRWGTLGVQVFFVISGFCIANAAMSSLKRDSPGKRFAAARVRRIYPPYLIMFALYCLASLGARHLLSSRPGESSLGSIDLLHQSALWYLSNLTLTQALFQKPEMIFVAWTLNYEIAFYLIVGALIWAACKLKKQEYLLTAMHVMSVLCLLWCIVAPHTIIFPFKLLPQFGFGVAVYDIIAYPKERRGKAALGILTAMTLVFCALYNLGGFDSTNETRWSFLATAGFAAVLSALYRYDQQMVKNRLVELFARIGVFSYSIYLIHNLIIGFAMQIGRRILPMTTHNFVVFYIGQGVAVLISAYVFYLFGEKPFISNKQKLIHKAASTGEA